MPFKVYGQYKILETKSTNEMEKLGVFIYKRTPEPRGPGGNCQKKTAFDAEA